MTNKHDSLKEELIQRLYPLNRSLANDGSDTAFNILQEYLPFQIYKIPSGEQAFTWTIPKRWHVECAYVNDEKGNTIIDFEENPLYLASYSDSYTGWVTKDELLVHLSTSEKMPDHIPFSYKYYERDWHLSMEYNKFTQLSDERYYVDIKTTFSQDYMKLGEYTLPGSSDEIILFICNICHPFQVNDSIAGVATFVSIMLRLEKRNLKYTYKLLVGPETIGSLAYLHKFQSTIPKIKYSVFSEMTGIDRPVRLIKSKSGSTTIDIIAEYVLKRSQEKYEVFPVFSEPGNDEKVLNSPGFDIPAISIVRWPYKEYHTSADTPAILDYNKIDEAEDIIVRIIEILERDYIPKRKYTGYLCLSNYGLEKIARKGKDQWNDLVGNVLYSLDNKTSIFEIASKFNMDFDEIYDFCEILKDKELLER
jgi:aminopeptidase-like protein